jgi:hypothetical protein
MPARLTCTLEGGLFPLLNTRFRVAQGVKHGFCGPRLSEPTAPGQPVPNCEMDAVLPAFMFLAACGLATGLAFTFLAPETHGKPIPQDADPAATAVGGAAASHKSAFDRE